MSDMEIEGHIFPSDRQHAEGTRCERCGIIWGAREWMTCSAATAYLAEHGVPTQPKGPDQA